MAISPMDIHHKEFSTVRMGGYNKEEVDSFLDMVADELDRLLHRNQEQAESVEAMRQKASQFDSMQTTLQNALINAQKSADSIVEEARSQAEGQMKEAQEQSARILEEAHDEKAHISQNFAGIREQVLRYIATIRELLDNNQALIKEYESRISAAELKEPAAPYITAPDESRPSQTESPTIQTTPEIEEQETPGFRESRLPIPEMGATPFKIEEPVVEKIIEPSIPEFKVSPTLEDQPMPNLEVIPREPSPMPFEREVSPAVTTPPSSSLPPIDKPAMSTEQEMEMMRESFKMETETKPPRQTQDKPAIEEPGGEEKHFFWE